MSSKQEQAIELIKRFSPKPFGIRSAYYRLNGKNLELMFVVDEKKASSLISYLNSLSHIIEKEVRDIQINSSVYIATSKVNISEITKEEELDEIVLPGLSKAGVSC